MLRKRPVQSFGSQDSRTIPLTFVVDTCIFTRQRSLGTAWEGRAQDGSALGNIIVVPAGTYSAKLTVTFSMEIDFARAAHEALKLCAGTPENLQGAGAELGADVLAPAKRTAAREERTTRPIL